MRCCEENYHTCFTQLMLGLKSLSIFLHSTENWPSLFKINGNRLTQWSPNFSEHVTPIVREKPCSCHGYMHAYLWSRSIHYYANTPGPLSDENRTAPVWWGAIFLHHGGLPGVSPNFGDLKFTQLREGSGQHDTAGVNLLPGRLQEALLLTLLTGSHTWKPPARWWSDRDPLHLAGHRQEHILLWAQSPLPEQGSQQLWLGTSEDEALLYFFRWLV